MIDNKLFCLICVFLCVFIQTHDKVSYSKNQDANKNIKVAHFFGNKYKKVRTNLINVNNIYTRIMVCDKGII